LRRGMKSGWVGSSLRRGRMDLRGGKSGERLRARNLVIAWGSEPALPRACSPRSGFSPRRRAFPGTLPESMLIVGGNSHRRGVRDVFGRTGVRVTLIEMMERLLPGEEREAAALLTQELRNSGSSSIRACGCRRSVRWTRAGVGRIP
jgi:dihydrolipoamide dehydrogenase